MKLGNSGRKAFFWKDEHKAGIFSFYFKYSSFLFVYFNNEKSLAIVHFFHVKKSSSLKIQFSDLEFFQFKLESKHFLDWSNLHFSLTWMNFATK
jgi:hypothetical protein